jgi:hypothetical protein
MEKKWRVSQVELLEGGCSLGSRFTTNGARLVFR